MPSHGRGSGHSFFGMTNTPEPPARAAPRRLWILTAVSMSIGLVLLFVGPAWLGLTMLVVPAFGLLPLALEDRRRRR